MLKGQQLKKYNTNPVRCSIDSRPVDKNKKVGKKTNKGKVQLKLKKHLSQLPIDPYLESKENQSFHNIVPQRPHSSLVNYQEHDLFNPKRQPPNFVKKKKKHLSVQSVGRQSATSKNSCIYKNPLGKRRRSSQNSRSFEGQSAFGREFRHIHRRNNLSCNDVLEVDDNNKNQQLSNGFKCKILPKKSLKQSKKHSLNLFTASHVKLVLNPKEAQNQRVRSKNRKVDLNFKGSSMVNIGNKIKNPAKQKSSLNLGVRNPKKQQKAKVKTKKSKKFVISKDVSSQEEYPTQKYLLPTNKKNRSASRSRSRKGSTDHQHRGSLPHSKRLSFQHPFRVDINNSGIFNIMSASSGIIRSSDRSYRSAREANSENNSETMIMKKALDESSFDLREIRHYERSSPNYKQGQRVSSSAMKLQQSGARYFYLREVIVEQINQQYPVLSDEEKLFLSSVVLIQRKWRQYFLYGKIFHRRRDSAQPYTQISACLNMKQTRMQSISMNQMKNCSQMLAHSSQSKKKKSESQIERSSQKQPLETGSKQQQKCQVGIQVSRDLAVQNQNREQLDQRNLIQSKYQKALIVSTGQQWEQLQKTPPKSDSRAFFRTHNISFENQIFPQITYLSVRQAIIKEVMHKKLEHLHATFSSRRIDQPHFTAEKRKLEEEYKCQMAQLKKSQKDIKKGYLRYIECLHQTRLLKQSSSESLLALRKVSSEAGLMALLYQKFYKFQQLSDSLSETDSLKKLSEKILIRKEMISQKRRMNVESNLSHISDLNNSDLLYSGRSAGKMIVQSQRESLNRSENRHPYQADYIRTEQSREMEEFSSRPSLSKEFIEARAREGEKANISEFLAHSKKLSGQRRKIETTRQEFQTIVVQQKRQYQQEIQIQDSDRSQLNFRGRVFVQFDSSERIDNQYQESGRQLTSQEQQKCKQIENLICEEFTKQFHSDLLRFETLQVEMFSPRTHQQEEYYEQQEEQQEEQQQDEDETRIVRGRSKTISFSTVEQMQKQKKRVRQVQDINRMPFQVATISIQKAADDKLFPNQLNMVVNKVSPQSSYRASEASSETEQIIGYLKEFILYIAEDRNIFEPVHREINEDQGFSAISYLRFLRDFELPEDEYRPIVSNEAFVRWETQYFQKHEIDLYYSELGERSIGLIQLLKQSQTIFHRCIFQALMSEVQKKRRYGERGKAFPWQNNNIHSPYIDQHNLLGIFNKSLEVIRQFCSYKCGIIDSKHICINEQELQRVHDENEDRIIAMLEDELGLSSHNWYELQQHHLQVRLEIALLLQQQCFEEVVLQISRLKNSFYSQQPLQQ